MWLDDVRDPVLFGRIGWVWVKTAKEAIKLLKTGTVIEASLDHDLSTAHNSAPFRADAYDNTTGYDVACWMEANNVWPSKVYCHSANPWGKQRIEQVIRRKYGKVY